MRGGTFESRERRHWNCAEVTGMGWTWGQGKGAWRLQKDGGQSGHRMEVEGIALKSRRAVLR